MRMEIKVGREPGRCDHIVGRRLLILLLCLAAVPAAAAAASAAKPTTWANKEIRTVTSAGLMGGGNLSAFRAADPLTAQQLEDLVFDLKERLAPPVEEGPDPVWPPRTTSTGPRTTAVPATAPLPATTTGTTPPTNPAPPQHAPEPR